jgi:hypothetical protein
MADTNFQMTPEQMAQFLLQFQQTGSARNPNIPPEQPAPPPSFSSRYNSMPANMSILEAIARALQGGK